MRRVAIIQHEPSVPPGLIADVLVEASGRLIEIPAWRDDALWPSAEDIDGLVVMGGTMNVDQLDDFPFLRSSRALMAAALNRGVPTLGVCLGSQMMARVLDAPVRRVEPRNAFFSRLDVTDAGATDPLLQPFVDVDVLQFHEDTFVVPDGAVALARSSRSHLPQAFKYGDSAYAIQFHFEVNRRILEGWLGNIGRAGMLEDWGCSEEDLLAAADRALGAQAVAGGELVRRFLALEPSDARQESVGT